MKAKKVYKKAKEGKKEKVFEQQVYKKENKKVFVKEKVCESEPVKEKKEEEKENAKENWFKEKAAYFKQVDSFELPVEEEQEEKERKKREQPKQKPTSSLSLSMFRPHNSKPNNTKPNNTSRSDLSFILNSTLSTHNNSAKVDLSYMKEESSYMMPKPILSSSHPHLLTDSFFDASSFCSKSNKTDEIKVCSPNVSHLQMPSPILPTKRLNHIHSPLSHFASENSRVLTPQSCKAEIDVDVEISFDGEQQELFDNKEVAEELNVEIDGEDFSIEIQKSEQVESKVEAKVESNVEKQKLSLKDASLFTPQSLNSTQISSSLKLKASSHPSSSGITGEYPSSSFGGIAGEYPSFKRNSSISNHKIGSKESLSCVDEEVDEFKRVIEEIDHSFSFKYERESQVPNELLEAFFSDD